jgi:alpha-glucosidase
MMRLGRSLRLEEVMIEPLWWQRGVVYQIYPRSYLDTDGDGIGNLAGITEKIDYLHDVLGVDAVWLSPFFPSPMADFGYDVSDYTDVDPMFGTMGDFDALVETLHARGMKLIIDYVINHSSDQHPWFMESRSSRSNPKRDWYVWADARPDGSPPNNWQSLFGGSAWQWDEQTGQYYLHSFLKEQPDLNWRNPEVEAAMFDVLRFWMERGVDGFRIDAAHIIMKDLELRDNPLNPDHAGPPDAYDAQLHLHDKAHEDIHAVFRRLRSVLDDYSAESPRMAVAEIHIFDWPLWATYYGTALDEIHMPFNFGLLFSDWTSDAVRGVVEGVEGALVPGAWPNYVLGNHDEPRLATRLGAAQARVAMMLLLTLRGTPTLYYGDEIGMHDVDIPAEKRQDPAVGASGQGRDPERTPMQWTSGPNAGFCPPSVEPWLPVAADSTSINVERECDDSRSMLALTRKLLAARRGSPALETGDYRPYPSPEGTFVFGREQEGERWLVALNLTGEERTVGLPGASLKSLLSTAMDRDALESLDSLVLRPNEGCLLQLTVP